MNEKHDPQDICPRRYTAPAIRTVPHAPGIYPASVYRCESTSQAGDLLQGELDGFVYQRESHPNAAILAERCRDLHAADWAVVAGSGISAIAAAVLSLVKTDDHIVASNQLYGGTHKFLAQETERSGINLTLVDTTDVEATKSVIRDDTKLLMVETITNPLLRVSDIPALAELTIDTSAKLFVDNTFATPLGCRPLELGADLVMESVSKMMNGHSDVMLGMLAGRHGIDAQPIAETVAVWGLSSSPFDCWLSARGLSTLHLRFNQACTNARQVATALATHEKVALVHYPGLTSHLDHAQAETHLSSPGWMVTFDINGGIEAAESFIKSGEMAFCPSLGEVDTTLSHPASTSHRGLSVEQRTALGISDGTVRMSVGTEPTHSLLRMVHAALDQI